MANRIRHPHAVDVVFDHAAQARPGECSECQAALTGTRRFACIETCDYQLCESCFKRSDNHIDERKSFEVDCHDHTLRHNQQEISFICDRCGQTRGLRYLCTERDCGFKLGVCCFLFRRKLPLDDKILKNIVLPPGSEFIPPASAFRGTENVGFIPLANGLHMNGSNLTVTIPTATSSQKGGAKSLHGEPTPMEGVTSTSKAPSPALNGLASPEMMQALQRTSARASPAPFSPTAGSTTTAKPTTLPGYPTLKSPTAKPSESDAMAGLLAMHMSQSPSMKQPAQAQGKSPALGSAKTTPVPKDDAKDSVPPSSSPTESGKKGKSQKGTTPKASSPKKEASSKNDKGDPPVEVAKEVPSKEVSKELAKEAKGSTKDSTARRRKVTQADTPVAETEDPKKSRAESAASVLSPPSPAPPVTPTPESARSSPAVRERSSRATAGQRRTSRDGTPLVAPPARTTTPRKKSAGKAPGSPTAEPMEVGATSTLDEDTPASSLPGAATVMTLVEGNPPHNVATTCEVVVPVTPTISMPPVESQETPAPVEPAAASAAEPEPEPTPMDLTDNAKGKAKEAKPATPAPTAPTPEPSTSWPSLGAEGRPWNEAAPTPMDAAPTLTPMEGVAATAPKKRVRTPSARVAGAASAAASPAPTPEPKETARSSHPPSPVKPAKRSPTASPNLAEMATMKDSPSSGLQKQLMRMTPGRKHAAKGEAPVVRTSSRRIEELEDETPKVVEEASKVADEEPKAPSEAPAAPESAGATETASAKKAAEAAPVRKKIREPRKTRADTAAEAEQKRKQEEEAAAAAHVIESKGAGEVAERTEKVRGDESPVGKRNRKPTAAGAAYAARSESGSTSRSRSPSPAEPRQYGLGPQVAPQKVVKGKPGRKKRVRDDDSDSQSLDGKSSSRKSPDRQRPPPAKRVKKAASKAPRSTPPPPEDSGAGVGRNPMSPTLLMQKDRQRDLVEGPLIPVVRASPSLLIPQGAAAAGNAPPAFDPAPAPPPTQTMMQTHSATTASMMASGSIDVTMEDAPGTPTSTAVRGPKKKRAVPKRVTPTTIDSTGGRPLSRDLQEEGDRLLAQLDSGTAEARREALQKIKGMQQIVGAATVVQHCLTILNNSRRDEAMRYSALLCLTRCVKDSVEYPPADALNLDQLLVNSMPTLLSPTSASDAEASMILMHAIFTAKTGMLVKWNRERSDNHYLGTLLPRWIAKYLNSKGAVTAGLHLMELALNEEANAGRKCGFDLEDFHSVIKAIEEKYHMTVDIANLCADVVAALARVNSSGSPTV